MYVLCIFMQKGIPRRSGAMKTLHLKSALNAGGRASSLQKTKYKGSLSQSVVSVVASSSAAPSANTQK